MYGFNSCFWETINQGDFHHFTLLKDQDYISLDGTHYRLPKNGSTDLASTPSIIWGAPLFLVPFGWYSRPTIGHDFAYRNILLIVNLDGTTKLANLTKKQSDDLLLEMMNSVNPNPTEFEKLQRDAIYEGVCYGGYHSYKEDRD